MLGNRLRQRAQTERHKHINRCRVRLSVHLEVLLERQARDREHNIIHCAIEVLPDLSEL